jgi:hypothetical protein
MDELPRYQPIHDASDDRRLEVVKCIVGFLFLAGICILLYMF